MTQEEHTRSAGETGILPAATIGMLMLIVAALLMKDFASVLFLADLVTQVGIICRFTTSNKSRSHGHTGKA